MPHEHGVQKGFTLVEMLISVVIIGVLLAIAVPSFNDFFVKNRVKRAAVEVQGLIAQAKAETVTRDSDMSVSLTEGASDTWCIGYAATAGCDCSNTTSCVVKVGGTDVTQRILGTEFTNVTLTGEGTYDGSTFDAVRGMLAPGNNGTITLSSGNSSLQVIVSLNGRVRICGPADSDIRGYPVCP